MRIVVAMTVPRARISNFGAAESRWGCQLEAEARGSAALSRFRPNTVILKPALLG